jgi:hypothetical protein
MAGYGDLPINANVEFYSHGTGENTKVWTNPEKYNPDRFMSGREDADTTGVTGVKAMHFGVGRRVYIPWSMAGHCASSPNGGKEWFKNLPIHLIASWISLWSWSLQWLWRTASALWSSLGLKLWQVNYIIDFLLKNVGDLYNLLCLYILSVLFHWLIDIGDCWRHSFLILLPLRPILGTESVYMGNLRMGVLPQCTFFISSPCHAYPMGTEIFC